MSTRALDEEFYAKYPFTSAARRYVEGIGIRVEELGEERHVKDIERAVRRVVEALEKGEGADAVISEDLESELLSFPIALLMVAALRDGWLARRWALAEASRCEYFLLSEKPEVVEEMLPAELGVRVARTDEEERSLTPYCEFKVKLADYVSLTSRIDALEWKLVNRVVSRGWVYVTQRELARLVREAVQRRILTRLREVAVGDVPDFLRPHVESIRQRLMVRRSYEEASAKASEEAWPPCMRALKAALLRGENVGHFGNFSLASFLINAGFSVDEVVAFYTQRSDFDERIARYQAEHIAGQRGSRTRYTTPSCATMRTHGLCIEEGRLCPGVKNPIQYYRRAARRRMPREEGKRAEQPSP